MNDERRTPRWLFDALNAKFDFTIDAAATGENALVDVYWNKEVDALKQQWNGHVVWCNPPYSRGQLVQWVHKAVTETLNDVTTVMLLPGDCSTEAGQMALRRGRVLFLNKRLAFDNEPHGAKFASWIVLFGGKRRDIANLYLMGLGVIL